MTGMAQPLDAKDRAILALLQDDARVAHAEIARRVGLTQPAVYERIRRLEQRGVIRGYHTILDPEALGRPVTAYISVGTSGAEAQNDLAIAALPDVLEVHHVAGEESFVVKVRTESPRSLEALLEKLRAIPGVTRTKTTIVLSTRLERTALPVSESLPEQAAS
jgi:Lrp/AsnC family leucine-responsive transcriptional regulator